MTITDFESRRYVSSKGQEFETRPHFATFNAKHNASKVKALIVLYHRAFTLRQTSGLTLGDLHRQSGVDYFYLKTRLAKWVGWKYLQKHIVCKNGKPCYSYNIAERGKHFIEDIVPAEWLKAYIAEIRTFKTSQNI